MVLVWSVIKRKWNKNEEKCAWLFRLFGHLKIFTDLSKVSGIRGVMQQSQIFSTNQVQQVHQVHQVYQVYQVYYFY